MVHTLVPIQKEDRKANAEKQEACVCQNPASVSLGVRDYIVEDPCERSGSVNWFHDGACWTLRQRAICAAIS